MTFAQLFALATSLGIVALVAMVVQEDVLPGVSQDWLIRPIRRSDLLCAKLLFVVVAVHGPMLLADIAHGIAAGFAFRESLAAALARSVSMLLVFELPVFALAAMTRTLVQIAAAAVGIWLVVVAGVIIGIVARGGAPPVFAASGIQWMTPAFWALLAFGDCVPQSFRCSIFAGPPGNRAGSSPARSFLRRCSACRRGVRRFRSSARCRPRRRPRGPLRSRSIPVSGDRRRVRSRRRPLPCCCPLRVSGLAPDSIVMNDRAEVRLVGPDGATIFHGRTTATLGYGDDFPVRTTEGGDVRTHQRIVLPDKVYEHVRAMSVHMEIDYSLTLFLIQAVNTMPATNGEGRFSVLGRCATKMDEEGDDIEVGCVNVGAAPTCILLTLEDPATGTRNPENPLCDPDYAPYRVHVYPDVMNQLTRGLRFRDPQGLTRYPVDGSRLAATRVRLTSYRPAAHFTRRLVIPDVHLSEWATNAAPDTIH